MAIRTLAAALAAFTALTTAALADQTETALYSRSGAWEIRVDATLANSCYMTTSYRDGTVRLAYDNTHKSGFLSIKNSAWASLVDGTLYDVTIQVDKNAPTPFKAQAITDSVGNRGLFIGFKDPEYFMPIFGLTNQMHLNYQGREIGGYNLVGTAQAITAMTACNTANGGPTYTAKAPVDPFKAPADPFKPTAPARAIDPFKV